MGISKKYIMIAIVVIIVVIIIVVGYGYGSYPKLSFTDWLAFLYLKIRDWFLASICWNYTLFLMYFSRASPTALEWESKLRAKRAFYNANDKVPAYKQFCADNKCDNFENMRETDKENYVKKYPIKSRCLYGTIPKKGICIDESSGSTGTPYNWIRNTDERHFSHRFISYFDNYAFGRDTTIPRITINAFSMGAWATGLNMGIACQLTSIVKNTGPDIKKIFNTLDFFGTNYRYTLLAYPPFLKKLIDTAKKERFPLYKYQLEALVGGEGLSEGLRDYLLTVFKKVYSGYGATDLEIGIAAETPLSVMIRRLANTDSRLRNDLFGKDSRLPMLFQYNPLMHYIEVNKNKELVFTITRENLLAPRIKYNIHDEGGIMRYDELADILEKHGYSIDTLIENTNQEPLPFPFVWVYGRRDFTISIMGANIYPEDLEHCVYADKKISEITRSFCQSLEDSNGTPRPAFYFEIDSEIDRTNGLYKYFTKSVLNNLIKLNADFREAYHESPENMKPIIYLYGPGEGPFAKDSDKIKQTRFIK